MRVFGMDNWQKFIIVRTQSKKWNSKMYHGVQTVVMNHPKGEKEEIYKTNTNGFEMKTLNIVTYLESLEQLNSQFICEKTRHLSKKETIIPLEMLDGNCSTKEVCSKSLKKSLSSNGDEENSIVFLVGDQGVVRDFLGQQEIGKDQNVIVDPGMFHWN
jgi:hypothetical protein